ncbi:PssE/Cps14G family polysaccharide biosynthesis glycosyltransferase [Turicibacter sp. H121]|uniref:PssE/Cps14G family polysaccharide biosynthesis glycosyltransferase n=1 Tax=Turicibacter sp. H121 TaxID=1712675 RepID=UPI000762FAF0|nr:PssE/Cps14G family polysaccharide biosynthesis glycosyltransferase [Turicibacter sp. H121]AMC08081.1 beta(1,3)galactosyltransferase EpsH [Turicibacter sp. H121]MCU7199851.1 beta(1,3)galactosyltransferase EpsH [Turicibacter sp. H121]
MIFITLGSQKFQFNRLLEAVDKLIEEGFIKEKVYAQIGYSTYIPKNYSYSPFLNREDFIKYMGNCDILITHGGTGAIITGLKSDKKVIAVPRLSEFGEHVDDHQLEIVSLFEKNNYLISIVNILSLGAAIEQIHSKKFRKYYSNTSNVVSSIRKYIEEIGV